MNFCVVMLAGSLRPSEIQASLGIPPVCLPLTADRTLLELWRERLEAVPGYLGGLVALSGDAEVEAVRCVLGSPSSLQAVSDPRPWRGMAGLLRDLRPQLPQSEVLVAVEGGILPPRDLRSLLAPFDDPDCMGSIGADQAGEAFGAFGLRSDLLARVRSVGYRDLKEQLLPELHAQGHVLLPVVLGRRVIRVRNMAGYLEAVSVMIGDSSGSGRVDGSTGEGPVPRGRRVRSLVMSGARVADTAMLADAVVLDGAVVGDHAVVSRSVVGPGAEIDQGVRLIGRILTVAGGPGRNLVSAVP